MGLTISIGVSGQYELSRTLGVNAAAIKDLTPAWNEIEKGLGKLQRSVFMNKGAYAGLSAWTPLKPATIKQKEKITKRFASFPLIRTQKLMNAWTKSDSAGSIRIKEPLFFIYGIDENEIPYARFHQVGTNRLPVRQHLRLPDATRTAIVKTIQTHIVKSGQFKRETVFG
jgi:hypothetical protein